jgi:hypothetical protein
MSTEVQRRGEITFAARRDSGTSPRHRERSAAIQSQIIDLLDAHPGLLHCVRNDEEIYRS